MGKHTAFQVANACILTLTGLSMVLPFINLAARAFSSQTSVIAGEVMFLPKGFQLDTIGIVIKSAQFYRSVMVSVTVTLAGVLLAVLLTVMTAYPFSKIRLKGRKWLMLVFIAAMLFNPGMIPNYLLYRALKLTNTIYALIFSGMFSVINMLLVKSYFETLPASIEEAAKIDGANDFYILFRIVLPMSSPVIAAVTLFYAVAYWGNYFAGVLYITEPSLRPLPQYLYELITITAADCETYANVSAENIRAAAILISTLPIIILYPFVQKFLVNGITLGGSKE